MKKPLIVGVMGGGLADDTAYEEACKLGKLIAENGWILLNGGRNSGIMDASAKGAADAGGLTIGILPDDHDNRVSEHIQVPILTGMGNARNCINVLSSNVIVACSGGAGTISEIALALKTGKTVICLKFDTGTLFASFEKTGQLLHVTTSEEVVSSIKRQTLSNKIRI